MSKWSCSWPWKHVWLNWRNLNCKLNYTTGKLYFGLRLLSVSPNEPITVVIYRSANDIRQMYSMGWKRSSGHPATGRFSVKCIISKLFQSFVALIIIIAKKFVPKLHSRRLNNLALLLIKMIALNWKPI